MQASKPFNETWAYPSELKNQLGAISYDTRPLNESFRTGRAKFECIFRGTEQRVISRRLAMQLTSRRGEAYYVCLRGEPMQHREPATTPTTPLADESSALELVYAA